MFTGMFKIPSVVFCAAGQVADATDCGLASCGGAALPRDVRRTFVSVPVFLGAMRRNPMRRWDIRQKPCFSHRLSDSAHSERIPRLTRRIRHRFHAHSDCDMPQLTPKGPFQRAFPGSQAPPGNPLRSRLRLNTDGIQGGGSGRRQSLRCTAFPGGARERAARRA
jgi:hypothetical protein